MPSKKAALSLQFCAAGVGGALTGTVCPVAGPSRKRPLIPKLNWQQNPKGKGPVVGVESSGLGIAQSRGRVG